MFFVAEYTNMIIGSMIFVTLFLGGWTLPFVTFPAGIAGALLSILVFVLKVVAVLFLFVWVRWTLPRFRYDQVMKLGWGTLMPLAIFNLVLNAVLAYLNR